MSDLFWPGDERSGPLMSQPAFLDAMVRVEQAWLDALVAVGVAPATAKAELRGLTGEQDVDVVAAQAESGGNPVLPLLALLRKRLDPEPAAWLHRGLTSQDVVDSALMVCVVDVLDRVRRELVAQVGALRDLAVMHRETPMAGRTLTQHAVPITFGLKAAGWLGGLLDAARAVDEVAGGLRIQVGGAAGTLAAALEWATVTGGADPAGAVRGLVAEVAGALGLRAAKPWHTTRAPVTAVGDALVTATDAWGRMAADVLLLARPEIGELSEPAAAGRGGSSTMPHKQNPVLSVLIRRAAIAVPPLAATLHTASGLAVDERPDGAWHVEWATLRTLSRLTVTAGSQATELLGGLVVHGDRMRQTLDAAAADLLAERDGIHRKAGVVADHLAPQARSDDPAAYLGLSSTIVDAMVARADDYLATLGGRQ